MVSQLSEDVYEEAPKAQAFEVSDEICSDLIFEKIEEEKMEQDQEVDEEEDDEDEEEWEDEDEEEEAKEEREDEKKMAAIQFLLPQDSIFDGDDHLDDDDDDEDDEDDEDDYADETIRNMARPEQGGFDMFAAFMAAKEQGRERNKRKNVAAVEDSSEFQESQWLSLMGSSIKPSERLKRDLIQMENMFSLFHKVGVIIFSFQSLLKHFKQKQFSTD